jgi:hypothetical protein
MKRILVGIVATVAATLAMGGGVAFAGGSGFPTTVEINGLALRESGGYAFGRITSPRKACISERELRVYLVTEGDRELMDMDRASLNGFFAGGGAVDFGTEVLVRAPRKRLGPGRSCAPGSAVDMPSLAVGAAAALAGGQGFSTQVVIDALGGAPLFAAGSLSSPREACLSRRKVRVFAVVQGENELVDADTASLNGFFAGGGRASAPAEGVRASAPRKRLRPGRSCAPGSGVLIPG